MLDELKRIIAGQYEAALATLAICIERCPDALWNVNVGNHPFNQVVFHVLFFADYYLDQSEVQFKRQPFHEHHQAIFAGYEQLQPCKPASTYDRPFIESYAEHCRRKAVQTLAVESQQTLTTSSPLSRRGFSRAELHVYNIRHIQHHAAQLILRLRQESDVDIPWIGSGWRDFAAAR